MKKFFKVLSIILLIVVFLGTFIYLFINSQEKKTEYEIISPKIDTVEKTTVLTGKIEPRDEIEIKPQVSGIIAEINVEAGDFVHEGDIIAKIKVIPDEGQLSSARNRVSVAELSVSEKKLEFERTKTLYEKKFESREKYEQDKNAYDQALQELKGAQDALAIVRDGVSMENAQSSNTLVRATITGLVLEVPVKVGSSVIQANTMNDGTTIAKVADMNNLIFKGKIDETEVDLLAEGMPMKISIGAIANSSLDATIEKIAPIATEDNGANYFEIKAAIVVDSVLNLRAGYSANATVTLAIEKDVLTIPEKVIEFNSDSAFVYVMTDSLNKKFEKTAVKTGLSDGINVHIKDSVITTSTRLRGNELN